LKLHLSEHGFSDIIDRLSGRDVIVHAGFARADATLDEAERGWYDTLRSYQQAKLSAELREASAKLGENMTDEAWERFKAAKKALSESSGEEADADADGAAGGRSVNP
jgi:DNA primase